VSKASGREWLHAHKLEYVPLNSELAVLRVLAGLNRSTPLPGAPMLVAGAPHTIVRAPVLGSVTHRPSRRMRTADHLLWRATFALPIELLECPQTIFALVAQDRVAARLPTPELSSFEALCRHWELGARGASLISGLAWRRAAALGTAVAVAGSSVLPPAVALAGGHHLHTGLGRPAVGARGHRAASAVSASPVQLSVAQHVVGHTGESTQLDLAKQLVGHHRRHHHRHGHRHTTPAQPSKPPTTGSSTSPVQTSVSSGGTSSGPGSSSPAATSTVTATSTVHRSHHRHHRALGPSPAISQTSGLALSTISPTAPAGLIDKHLRHHHGHHTGAPGSRPAFSGGASLPSRRTHHSVPPRPAASETEPVATPTPSSLSTSSSFLTGMGMSAGEVALLSHLSGLYVKGLQPPAFLIPIYKNAGKRFHIPWQVLAAINSIETNYGRDLNVSSAGAVGWMQFMPSTWREYGLSIKGNGPPNPYDPTDAIFSAARYLAANGGAHHLRKAIFAYNHAIWYVDSVLWRAGIISEHVQGIHHLGGYALPLDGKYMRTFGRTDDGLDIEDAPDGAAVYSITPGVVTAVASDPTGFGPNYPVIRVTKGPLTGQYVYYGHVAASLVKPGQHVMAGQPIAIMGHTGDAVSLGHGHIEIGFSDSSGDPLNHHGAVAWTPSGAAMRRVLVALAAGFHIKVR
jgi:transglycosylase-like protein with SLT domain/peptidase M23-like protein